MTQKMRDVTLGHVSEPEKEKWLEPLNLETHNIILSTHTTNIYVLRFSHGDCLQYRKGVQYEISSSERLLKKLADISRKRSKLFA